MKNIHILPTTQPSKLYISFDELIYNSIPLSSKLYYKTQHIYITNEEEIKDGDHYINFEEGFGPKSYKYKDYGVESLNINNYNTKKIILTTDPLLIKDGVQTIEDNFIKWFVENPYTEYVEVKKEMYMPFDGIVPMEISLDKSLNTRAVYKIITEPKQETLQEDHVSYKLAENLFTEIYGYPPKIIEGNQQHETIVAALQKGMVYGSKYSKEELQRGITITNVDKPKEETFEEAAERLSELQEGTYTSEHKITYKHGFIDGAKYQEQRMFSEKDLKQFAFESVAKFLSNKDNQIEMGLAEVISDRIDENFNEFKNKK